MKKKEAFVIICLILVHISNVIAIYVFLPQRMFGIHLDKVPLYEPLKSTLESGRIMTIGHGFFNYKIFPGLYGHTAPYLGFN